MLLITSFDEYSFTPPSLSLSTSLPGGANAPDSFGGSLDQLLDPIELDYVRTTNGEWQQTADSRTIMLIAMSVHLGESPFDPTHGTAIAELMRSGDLVSPEMLQSETVRVGQILAGEAIIGDLLVAVRDDQGNALVDGKGTNIVHTSWRDLASGSPLNQSFSAG